jgi:hypothetical protein
VAAPPTPGLGFFARFRHRWLSKRALLSHLALVLICTGCGVATRWQIGVAEGGNSIGWVYTFMWPGFAIFSLIAWWHLVHDDRDLVAARGLYRQHQPGDADSAEDKARTAEAIAKGEAEDPELAAYNNYLRHMSERSRPRRWNSG